MNIMKGAEMRNAVKTICTAVIISLLWLPPCLNAGTLPKAATLVPPETVLLVEVDNFSQFRSQFEKTNLYKLYKDPSMAPFVEKVKEKLREKVQKMDGNNIFRAFYDADVLPKGRAAFALVLNEQTKDANEPSVLFFTQWGENIDKMKKAISKMLEKNIELGGHQKRAEDYRGVSIETLIDEGGTALHHCYIDDCLIMSADLDVLKFVIAHIKGSDSPTLSSESNYTATLKAVGPHHDIDVYVNIKQLVKTAVAEDSGGQVQRAITNLGFDNVSSAGVSFGFAAEPGASYISKAIVKIDGEKKGICKMLAAESSVLKAPRFIPASVYAAMFFNLDIKKAYNELVNIVTAFSPGAAAVLYMPLLPAGPEGGPSVKLKEDIIDHLGSEVIVTQSIKKPFSKDKMPVEYVLALGVNNRSALEKAMSLLHSQRIAPNDPQARRELLGHTIYRISLEGFMPFFRPGMQPMQAPGEESAKPLPILAFTITDTHLIFALESTVEGAIRTLSNTETATISSAKWFVRSKPAVPSGLVCMGDDEAAGELLWWSLKESKQEAKDDSEVTVGAGVGSASGLILSQSGLFDGSILPEFDAVRKYFGSSVFYGLNRPDGFFFESRALNPSGGN